MVKNLSANARDAGDVSPWVGTILWRRVREGHSSLLAWRIPWTEELGGYSPWGCKESDTTERLITAPSTVCFRSLCVCFCLMLTLSSSLCLGCSALLSSPRCSPRPARDPRNSPGFCSDLPDPGEGLRDGTRLSVSRRAVTACGVDVALFQKARSFCLRGHLPAGLRLMLTARRNPATGKRPQCRQPQGWTQRWPRDSWDLRTNYFSQ